MRCWICGNQEGNTAHRARELAYGTREPFTYSECGACGCLHIAEVPADLERYYRGDYYSLRAPQKRSFQRIRDLLRRCRAASLLGSPSLPGAILSRLSRTPEHWPWLRRVGASRDTRILDVGCGQGGLLRRLRAEGFRALTGVDPFIAAPVEEDGLTIHKAQLRDLEGSYDLVMMHHSLEHIADQAEVLAAAHRLLRPGGWALIRIPLLAWAWRTYGTEWVQLDAPRHLVLHSERSMRLVAERAGFEVAAVEYDSDESQILWSERYRRGIPLWGETPPPRPRPAELRAMRRKARELNAARDGDQACFYLRRR